MLWHDNTVCGWSALSKDRPIFHIAKHTYHTSQVLGDENTAWECLDGFCCQSLAPSLPFTLHTIYQTSPLNQIIFLELCLYLILISLFRESDTIFTLERRTRSVTKIEQFFTRPKMERTDIFLTSYFFFSLYHIPQWMRNKVKWDVSNGLLELWQSWVARSMDF